MIIHSKNELRANILMMETLKVVYKGGLRTESTHLKSGSVIVTDAPVDNHGKGESFSPTDLLCSSLASCMITVMGIAAETHQINFSDITCKVTKMMEVQPRKVKQIIIDIEMGSHSYSAKEKSMLMNTAKTCPVGLSLSSELLQSVSFQFIDEKILLQIP